MNLNLVKMARDAGFHVGDQFAAGCSEDDLRKLAAIITDEIKTIHLDSTGVAAVDHNYFWQPIETCPRGAKVQLLGKGGVALYGQYHGKDTFYTHWAPLPKLKKD